MKKKLIRISEVTGAKFAEVKSGVTTHLASGEVIPLEHINKTNRMKHGIPQPNGIYRLYEYTCDGGKNGDCSIGSPSKRCATKGWIIGSCAKYCLEKPSALISLNQCLKLMD